MKVISLVAYRLKLPIQWNIHPVFHASLLTPYVHFLLSYSHHLLMSSSIRCPSLASPPSKRAKKGIFSPPAPVPPSDPSPPGSQPVVGPDGALKPSVFNVLNIFRSQWFLNQDHLIANVLSAQKSDEGCYVWVDFQPPFHTHLVQRA